MNAAIDTTGATTMNSQVTIVEPESLEYLPAKTLLRLLEKQQSAAKNFKAFTQTVRAFPDLFRELESLDIEPSFSGDYEWVNLSFAGDGPKLGVVWGMLRRAGFNTDVRPQKGETEFYSFWKRDGHAQIFLHFTSSVCRRVKVGTKMVEQEIYETVCGELPELETPQTAVTPATSASDFDSDIPF